MKTRIWVICFEKPNEIGILSKQLLCRASSLLKKDEVRVSAVCIGNHTVNTMQSLSMYGADEVIHFIGDEIDYRDISSILNDSLQNEKQKPKLIMFPATEWGKCIAADLAIKTDAGLTAECIDIEYKKDVNEDYFIFTRAAINSSVLAQIKVINTNVSMCTCKENTFVLSEKYSLTKIPIYKYEKYISKHSFKLRILKSELITNEEKNIALENAQLVFGIGRGIQDKNGLNLIEQVAKKYNAAIAGTRAIVEEGFIEKRWQIGQSGISISPEVYVAIGVSGSTQHIVGIKNSKIIIAINTDKRAPIFSYANYCIVDDYRNIFKELI